MSTESFSLFDLSPGRVFAERFKIDRIHRHNGLVPAFAATDDQSGEDVCLMVFPPSLFEDSSQAEEFRAACQPWLRVRSPHCARVREIGQQSSAILWVTDPPRGTSLRKHLEAQKRVAPELAVRMGLDMLDGLIAIHDVGLVHGDVKPQTVYVEEKKRPQAQLVDGGVTPGLWNAKHLGERTALIGTPFYAPVEQFGGESPDVQSDVYNVATVLFEMIAGVLPWPGKSYLEVFQAKLDRHPPSIRRRASDVEITPELEKAIVAGMLADRRERYHSATEFRDALQAAAS